MKNFTGLLIGIGCFVFGFAIAIQISHITKPNQSVINMPAEQMNEQLYTEFIKSGYVCGKSSSKNDGVEDRVVCWNKDSSSSSIPTRQRRLY